MPTTLPFSTTGNPDTRCCCVSARSSRTVMSGDTVTGSRSTPDSKRLTLATSAACFLAVRFLWTMPMPPSCAMAIARRDSVTVSIAAETSGMLSWMLRVSRVLRLTFRGRTLEWAGTRRTSSKVRAFWTGRIATPKSRIIRRSQLPVNSWVSPAPSIDGCAKTRYGALHPSRGVRHASNRAACRRISRRIERAGAGPQMRRCRRENRLYAGPVSGQHETGDDVAQHSLRSGRFSRRLPRRFVRRQGGGRGQEHCAQDRGGAGTGVPPAPAGAGKGLEASPAEIRGGPGQGIELPQRPGAPRAIRYRRAPVPHHRAGRALLHGRRADRAGEKPRARRHGSGLQLNLIPSRVSSRRALA